MTHPYIPNADRTREEMLRDLGLEGVEELFSDIPEEFRLEEDLDIPRVPEMELKLRLKYMLSENFPYTDSVSFLGGGVWPHHVPSHVRDLVRRSELYTSYTPYQPEASQGMLQALFEYQSLICELTGMGAANASAYDWASALGEAALMSARLTGRDRFLVPEFISPDRLSTVRNYASGAGLKVEEVPQDGGTGQLETEELEEMLDGDTAGVYIENPGYLGQIQTNPDEISDLAEDSGAEFVVGVNPISLGLLRPPGDYGADIVVGEGQPLGNPVNFGGPSLGLFACREDQDYLHQLPGRVIGMAETEDGGTRGYDMVLQTREQHIRREEATSNLCTSQALNAVAAAIYLSSMGPSGLREVAEKCARNANYAAERMDEIEGVEAPLFDSPHFNEFVASFDDFDGFIDEINSELLRRGVHGGKPLEGEFPQLGESSLWCSTELHSKDDIDWMVSYLEMAGGLSL